MLSTLCFLTQVKRAVSSISVKPFLGKFSLWVYRSDTKMTEDFPHKVRMLAALAFVPEPDVINAFEAVSEDFPLDAQEVID